jgi:hypothetical protein
MTLLARFFLATILTSSRVLQQEGKQITANTTILSHSQMCSLIAIMLGTLRMDIDTCINEYIDMAQEIFSIENIISRSTLGTIVNTMVGTQRFDPEPLEKAAKRLVKKYLGGRSSAGENTVFKLKPSQDNKIRPCKV